MKRGTQQRIVGTVVLLALALIFLPIIFDGQGSYQGTLSSRIPAPPLVPVMPEPEQSRPIIIADTPGIKLATERTATPEPAARDTVEITTSEPVFTREAPSLDNRGLPSAWSVRLGSFSDPANAVTLLERLLASGYKAYKREFDRNQVELTGVYVGPWLDRARVDEYRGQLQQEFQLSGIVVRYEVEQR